MWYLDVFCLVKCPFGFCYVGKKKREFKGRRIRICEHKSSISNRDERPPVARHFNSAGHGVCKLGFMVIEAVRPPLRGGDRESLIGCTTYRLNILMVSCFLLIQMGVIDVNVFVFSMDILYMMSLYM